MADRVRPRLLNWKLTLLVLSYSALATALAVTWLIRTSSPEPQLPWDDEVRSEVQALMEERYLEPLTEQDANRLFDDAMKGYVGGLDPFSRYFSEDEREELEEDTKGVFGGIGVQVRSVPEGLEVSAVRIGGPADGVGVEPGETILSVDGTALAGRDLADMIGRVKGEPGTKVSLEVRAGDAGPRTVVVTRAMVDIDTVPWVRVLEGDPPVGYVRITRFSEATGGEFARALDLVLSKGAAALILDLRHNQGGVVAGAVDVASLLMPPGTPVCRTRNRGGAYVYETSIEEDEESEDGEEAREPVDLPLVLLVNRGTASASEILAGALQDHGRAVLVGERTYGKFLVQTIFPLQTAGTLVRLTTARYETPRGRSAQRDRTNGHLGGMMPDVRVSLATEEDENLLVFAFENDLDERLWRFLPEEEVTARPDDRQLEVALELIRGGGPPPETVPVRVP